MSSVTRETKLRKYVQFPFLEVGGWVRVRVGAEKLAPTIFDTGLDGKVETQNEGTLFSSSRKGLTTDNSRFDNSRRVWRSG